jgi:DMSO/TMAO reductase YedYZ heme-binding membrane subunit
MFSVSLTDGTGADGLHAMLRESGRISALIFLLVFVARPAHQLVGKSWSRRLLENRRYIGISFAAAHTVHLYVILWLWRTVPEEVFAWVTIIVGGTGFLLMYLMLITSFDVPAKAIGSKAWRRLHKTGLYWIGFIFAFDFFALPAEELLSAHYLPYSIAMAIAIALRLAAWKKSR